MHWLGTKDQEIIITDDLDWKILLIGVVMSILCVNPNIVTPKLELSQDLQEKHDKKMDYKTNKEADKLHKRGW